ncbi:DivIVA domain-containing protein [Nibrella viscosa]|uniref:DivIVA domain-containing protein n=1 Tax=Nibrella viscosa TaxID=1084524 RepID=A0ABP8KHV8_9BACT
MKITPIEIRQHTFEKGLRGYKSEEVDAFLNSLSQEWERIISENKMLKMQLELAEKELNKLKEVELILFKTLKTAEDTSSQITEQANRAAEQYLGESRQKADEVLAEARKKSAILVQDAENQARYIKENILNDLKSIESDFKAMERYKENLIVQIQALANNALDSVDRFEKKYAKQSVKNKIDEVASQLEDAPANAETSEKAGSGETQAMPAVDQTGPLTEQAETAPVEAEASPAVTEGVTEAVEQQLSAELASTEEAVADAASDETASDDRPAGTTEPSASASAGEVEEPVTAGAGPVGVAGQPEPVPAAALSGQPKKPGGSFFDQF